MLNANELQKQEYFKDTWKSSLKSFCDDYKISSNNKKINIHVVKLVIFDLLKTLLKSTLNTFKKMHCIEHVISIWILEQLKIKSSLLMFSAVLVL